MSLAILTLLLAVARTLVSFRQVQRLSDARRQAVTDDLTGLGNRRSLFEHGAQRLEAADAADRLALILIDLDNFKEINDTFGHPAGDELLREIARRLTARASEHDLLVRLGGDEFAILGTLAPADDGRRIATAILDRITEPFVFDGARLLVGASAGVAERDAGARIVDLLRRADVAMYAAKDARSRVAVYDPELDHLNRLRLETIQDLDAALDQPQFVLHYQPKIEVASGATFRAEALVRWEHPTRGLLYPDAFLPVVEQSGMMNAVTWVVLEAAVRQLVIWKAGRPRRSASPSTCRRRICSTTPSPTGSRPCSTSMPSRPRALELEITESVIMLDPERARTVLEALRRLGLRIAIDDYGTGYCALAYLRDLPVDELKLDRSFVARVTTDPRSAAIVRSTIELAHALGLQVVAEGVEDRQTLDAVASFGCDYAQGYYFSRPVPAAAFAAAVRRAEVEAGARAFPLAS